MRTAKRGAPLFEHTYDRVNVFLLRLGEPFPPSVELVGVLDLLFHKWNITPMEYSVKEIHAFGGDE